MFRFRRNARFGRLVPNPNQALRRAFVSQSSERPGDAAMTFARLAQEAEASNQPRRGANLHAQAAHAYADAGDAGSAHVQSQAALRIFLQAQMLPRAQQFYASITTKLRSKNMTLMADALISEFGVQLESAPAQTVSTSDPHTQNLPVACPQCGGPILPDEADWIDDHTIECAYCGAMIQSN